MTDQKFDAWLADLSASRVVLAELHFDGGIEYVATRAFISRPSDSDPNRIYVDLLQSAIDISTRIDGMTQFGEVSLINDGELDPWLDRAWEGYAIELYLGDPEWPRDEFRLIAKGRNGGIAESRRGSRWPPWSVTTSCAIRSRCPRHSGHGVS